MTSIHLCCSTASSSRYTHHIVYTHLPFKWNKVLVRPRMLRVFPAQPSQSYFADDEENPLRRAYNHSPPENNLPRHLWRMQWDWFQRWNESVQTIRQTLTQRSWEGSQETADRLTCRSGTLRKSYRSAFYQFSYIENKIIWETIFKKIKRKKGNCTNSNEYRSEGVLPLWTIRRRGWW